MSVTKIAIERERDEGTSLLIVDRHRLFADAVRRALLDAGHGRVHVATSSAQAVGVAVGEPIDVALVDLGIEENQGIGVGRRILQARPSARLVAMTAREDPTRVREALRSGFVGAVVKSWPSDRFTRAVASGLSGEPVSDLAAPTPRPVTGTESDEPPPETLSRREREVLALLADGISTRVIARDLQVSEHTVRSHIQNVLEKLGLRTRLEATAYADRHGLRHRGSARRIHQMHHPN